ncbi:MAG TPA: hypothetical protein VNX68_06075 [Nitrosopumilaceae archaeon]|jgi:hypothetical protein|nr:hypothetical protein [Nitrosopumilaceae archaeon]
MNRVLSLCIMFYVLLFSCESKSPSLSDQLKTIFLSRLKKNDSTVILDSFRVIRIDSIDQRHQRIIDDTIYMREFARVQGQLINSIIEKKSDSIGFYQDEVNYMGTQLDSMNKEIAKADTISKLGLLVICKIQLSKHNRSQERILRYLLDMNMNIWNSSMIDSSIATMVRKLN